MKKLIINGLLPLILAVAISSTASAQDLALDTKNRPASADLYTSAEETKTTIAETDIDKRVLKDFKRSFGKVENTRWFKMEKGFGVAFKNADARTTVFYSSNGTMESFIHYYAENKLPLYVRTLVNSNFPDFKISHIAEVNKAEVVAYVIKIQDKSTVKTVKVIGDEWEITESLTKN